MFWWEIKYLVIVNQVMTHLVILNQIMTHLVIVNQIMTHLVILDQIMTKLVIILAKMVITFEPLRSKTQNQSIDVG